MWFGKEKFVKFAMALAMAVSAVSSAWAADASYSVDVRPFKFKNINNSSDTSAQLDAWGRLMKYKLFATGVPGTDEDVNGITFLGPEIWITDEVGYVGSAKGNLVIRNNQHVIGGPLMFGGAFVSGDGNDTISTGPVRFKKYFKTNKNVVGGIDNSSNRFKGLYCLEGGYGELKENGNDPVTNQMSYINATEVSVRVAGGSILSSAECASEDQVYKVDEDIYIPEVDTTWPSSLPSYDLATFNTTYIHVPPESVGDSGGYNYFVDHIAFGNHSKLYVVMPPGGRLTKIFVKGAISGIGNDDSTNVAVVHAAKMSEWNAAEKRWELTASDNKPVANKDYLGNLLFYTPEDIFMGAGKKSLQGTYVSAKSITLAQNTNFAGQLLAQKIDINAFFKASDFVFVPFNPSWIDVDPTADSWGTLYEGLKNKSGGDSVQTLMARLNKVADNDVTFKYCFVFKGKEDVQEGEEGDGLASSADIKSPALECKMVAGYDSSSVYKTATIKKGKLTLDKPIEVVVEDDDYIENTERFDIYIFSLAGAILSDKSKSGYFSVPIIDDDALPISKDFSVDVTEDVPVTWGEIFPIFDHNGNPWNKAYSVSILDTSKVRGHIALQGPKDDEFAAVELNRPIYDYMLRGDWGKIWQLKYYPPKDAYGVKYDTLKFVVLSKDKPSEQVYTMYINILPVNDKPEAVSNGFTIKEHGKTSEDRIATGGFDVVDPDDEQFIYKFDDNFTDGNTEANYNKVTSLFEMAPNTGTITVKEGVDLNYESPDSVLTIRVVVKDKSASTGNIEDALEDTLTVKITIEDINEAPSVAENQVFVVDENSKGGTSVLPNGWKDGDSKNVQATDPDLPSAKDNWGKFTYSIVEKDVPFVIDANTGNITVAKDAKLDFETKDEYTVTIKVVDGGKLEGTATITIKINDVNEPPSFDDDGTDNYEVEENSKKGFVVKKWEVFDNDAADSFDELRVTLEDLKTSNKVLATDIFDVRLVKDADEKMFVELFVADSAKLDFESIYKTLADSVFSVRVTLKDQNGDEGCNEVSLEKHVVVRDINEKPSIDNKDELKKDGLKVDENSSKGDTVGTVVASDPDIWNKFTFTLEDGDAVDGVGDSKLFDIDENGVITVAKDNALDYESDSIYVVKVIVTDNGKDKGFENMSDTVIVTIKLNDVNEDPEIITEPEDCEGDKCNECDAMVVDCDKPDVPPPTECTENCGGFVDGNVVLYVKENSKTGTKVLEYFVEDKDLGDLENMDVTMTDENGTGVDSLFEITPKLEKVGDKYKFVVTVKDGTKLDFEKVKETHKVTITVTDDENGTAKIIRTIKVVDVNEKHTVADISKNVDENLPKGTAVDTLVITDQDKNPEFRNYKFEILDSANVPFTLDAKDPRIIRVKDSSKLDYEKDPVLTFKVRVYDDEFTDTATVTIKLNDVNEKPTIDPKDPDCVGDKCNECDAALKDCSKPNVEPPADCEENCGYIPGPGEKDEGKVIVNVRENSPTGYVVFEYIIKDEDKGDLKRDSVYIKNTNKSGADSLFEIKKVPTNKDSTEYKLVVTVKDGKKLDYEAIKDVHELIIGVVDPDNLELRDEIERTIHVIDVNEPPFIVAKDFVIEEHMPDSSKVCPSDTTVPCKIEWGDDEKHGGDKNSDFRNNIVTVVGGDTAWFDVDKNGVITTKKEFDYESEDTSYVLIVKVSDKNDPTLSVVDTMHITIKNVEEKPWITTPEFTIPENPKKGDVIGQLESKDLDDPNDEQERTYEVKDNDYVYVEDGKIFVKDSSLFDFEKVVEIPIKVTVTDPDGLDSTTTVIIKITDVNEPPEVKDTTFVVEEKKPAGTTVGKVEGKDPDTAPENKKLTYTIIEGDTTKFKIDPSTGKITLKEPLDYESDSTYTIKVQVNDKDYADTATITINVKDVNEKSKVEITKVDDGDSVYVRPDSVYTRNPEVLLCWREGKQDDGKKSEWNKEQCEDVPLKPGMNVVVKEYKDPTTNESAKDSVVIFYSNALPTISIDANGEKPSAENIYTIVEDVDAKDTNVYVKKDSNDIFITIHDPSLALKGSKDSVKVITIPTKLDTVSVPKKFYDSMNGVVKEGVSLDVTAPNAERTPNADSTTNVSYVTKVNGVEVTVSYTENKKGDVVKIPVTHSNGKVTMDEVITVTYVGKDKNGKEITISYKADAVTGDVLYVDSEGNLMTGSVANKLDTEKGPNGNPTVGIFDIAYNQVSAAGDTLKVSYSVDKKGNLISSASGDIGYKVSYTYTDICGNSATQSVFIVLDQAPPVVKISSPTYGQTIYSNYVTVTWTVNGVEQDTLNVQGLKEGANAIVRFFRDKAGNEGSDTVYVMMKDGKNVEIALEQPVTEITIDKVDKYYAENPPKKDQTFAVSIKNPTTEKEVETLIGGSFDNKDVSDKKKEPYPGLKGHLGPTMSMDIRLPVVSDVGGMATLDDIVSSDGMVYIKGVKNENAPKIPVSEYVKNYCDGSVKASGDLSKVNLYKSKLDVKIWIYTSLGSFVDYYSFTQNLDDPDYANEAGVLQMYFELKPDKNGDVRTESGRLYATGSYIYKVQANLRSELKCALPAANFPDGKPKGDIVKNSDDLLKPFGYKRPQAR